MKTFKIFLVTSIIFTFLFCENKSDEPEPNVEHTRDSVRFIPGSKVIFFDDFSATKLGDFPAKWKTNIGGQVVELSGKPGKWLKVPDNTISFPAINTRLPKYFTIEFDLIYPVTGQRPPVTFGFSEVTNPATTSLQYKNIFYFLIPSSIYQHVGYSTSLYSGRETTTAWEVDAMVNKVIHVQVDVYASKIRLFLNNQKIFDLPDGFNQDNYRNNFHFRASPLIPAPRDGFYISNLRIAGIE